MARQGRLAPQHKDWFDDLPLRESAIEGEVAQFEEVSEITTATLSLSRAENMIRGSGVLFGTLLLGIAYFSLAGFPKDFIEMFARSPFVAIVTLLMSLVLFAVIGALLRFDLRTPRDLPVRFNRASGRVQALEWGFIWWNPFLPWPISVKEFDWADVQAEVHRQIGFNGRTFQVRYLLVLCVCKPCTAEVLERFTLKVTAGGPIALRGLWNFLRVYMKDGVEALPSTRLRPGGIGFRRSLFQYMRFWDPTDDGTATRKEMGTGAVIFLSLLTFWLFPLFVLLGLGHYIAMRCAPEPHWPNEAGAARDEVSRR